MAAWSDTVMDVSAGDSSSIYGPDDFEPERQS